MYILYRKDVPLVKEIKNTTLHYIRETGTSLWCICMEYDDRCKSLQELETSALRII